MSANVKLSCNKDGRGKLFVDGVDMTKGVSAVAAKIEGGERAEVVITLSSSTIDDIDISGAHIIIGGVQMPFEVEMALHRYLTKKHGFGTQEVTTIDADTRQYAPI